ncbi:MAG: hypothetical protein MUF15_18080 [Acidobacteria bacterium]|jgi:hypothetical protein|nr:hypothetical protein [Acidobacteriota bacterium]
MMNERKEEKIIVPCCPCLSVSNILFSWQPIKGEKMSKILENSFYDIAFYKIFPTSYSNFPAEYDLLTAEYDFLTAIYSNFPAHFSNLPAL